MSAAGGTTSQPTGFEWSDELYRICGMAEGSTLPRPADGGLFEFEHPDDRGRVQAAIANAVVRQEPFSFDVRIIRRNDGDVRDTATSGIVLTDEAGRDHRRSGARRRTSPSGVAPSRCGGRW